MKRVIIATLIAATASVYADSIDVPEYRHTIVMPAGKIQQEEFTVPPNIHGKKFRVTFKRGVGIIAMAKLPQDYYAYITDKNISRAVIS